MPRSTQFRLDDAVPVAFPLNPDALIEGDPQPELAILHTSEDGRTMSGIFRTTPGRFRVHQTGDEWAMVRRGRVRVTADDGSSVDCGPGDVYVLQRGGAYVFEVVEGLEDYFVISNPEGFSR